MSALTQSIKQKIYEVNELLTQLESEEAALEQQKQEVNQERTQIAQIKQILGVNPQTDPPVTDEGI